jgi:pimeloyl-ACP methyl ester carboxylesterase
MENVKKSLEMLPKITNGLVPDFYQIISGCNLAFYESQGQGETILMIHGNSSNSGNFVNQLSGELGNKYHLIAFDLPGCGNSQIIKDSPETFSFNWLADVLLEIIDFLNVPCWLVGHSLGSNIALYAAQKNPNNIKGFFLSGLLLVDKAEELAQAALPNPNMSLFYQKNLTETERITMATAGLYNPGHEIIEFISDAIEITNPLLRSGIAASIADPRLYIGHKQYLRSCKLPLALAEGKHDPFINREYLEKQEYMTLWRNKVQLVENSAHYPHIENHEKINLLLDQFICQ